MTRLTRQGRDIERMSDAIADHRRAWPLAAAIIVAVVCAAGVLWLPWHLPFAVKPVFSDAQSVGFVNRTAEISLGIGALAMFAIAWIGRLPSRPFLTLRPEGARVSRWLLIAAMVAGVAVFATLALVFREHPFAEAAYFVDRGLYLVNGSRPYIDFEFSYGPLLLYPQYLLWEVLRPIGVSVATAYYLCFAAASVTSLWLLSFVVDRLTLSRALKNALFASVALFDILQIGMGLDDSLVRFVTHLALLLAVLAFAARAKSRLASAAAAVGAVAFCFAISPEIGIALLVGLLAAFGVKVLRGDRRSWVPIGGLGLLALGLLVLIQSMSTFLGFAGGAFYFPVFPGPPALLYLGCLLLLAWGAGRAMRDIDADIAALQAGWLAAALVLVAAALGRADFGHIFWDGLGVFLVAPAIVYSWRRWASWGLVATTAATFLAVFAGYGVIYLRGPAIVAALGAGTLSPSQATQVANVVGADARWVAARAKTAGRKTPTPSQLAAIEALRSVAVPWQLESPIGPALATRGALAPSYGTTGVSTSADEQRLEGAVSKARWLLLYTSRYKSLALTAKTATTTSDPPLVIMPFFSGARPVQMLALFGWPLVPRARYPVLDSELAFARYLQRTWTPDHTVGGYTVLRHVVVP
jgi:hypothetical protein